MAIHNRSRILGYLPADPYIKRTEDGQEAMAQFTVVATHRNPTGYHGKGKQPIDYIPVMCDGNPKIMRVIETIKKGDFVDIEGLYNVLYAEKSSICEECGERNTKAGITCFVHPLFIQKVDPAFTEEDLQFLRDGSKTLDEYLKIIYEEVSNHTLLVGTVAQEPEQLEHGCTRYCLAIDRKYYIPTQSTIFTDYPFIYSYGDQGVRDFQYLKPGSLVMIDGFIRNRRVKNRIEMCQNCGASYTFDDYSTEIIPYSVEYFNNIKTEDEIHYEKELNNFHL